MWTAVLLADRLPRLGRARSASSCASSATTRSTAGSPPSPLSGARTSRTRSAPSAPPGTSSDGLLLDVRPRDLLLLPRLRGRPAQGRRRDRGRPGGALLAQEARLRLPLAGRQVRAARGRHPARRARRGRLLRQAAPQVRADALDLRRDLPALLRLVPQGDAGLAAREALGALDHPQGAQALQGADPLRRAPHEPRGLVLPALARSRRRPSSRWTASASGRRPPTASARAPTSRSSRRSASPTAWGCSTAPSPTTSASRSTAPSTRSWASPPTGSPCTSSGS